MKKSLAFLAVYLGWGSLYLAIRFAVEDIPPFLMTGSSSLIAGAFLYLFALSRGVQAPGLKQLAHASLAGLALLAVGNGLIAIAVKSIPSSLVALLLATEPAWMVLMDWLFFKGEKPRAGVFAGIVLGLMGIALLVAPRPGADPTQTLIAASFVLGAAFSWSWGSLYCRKADISDSSIMAIALPVLMGAVFLLILSAAAGEWASFSFSRVQPRAIAAFLYITAISYTLTYVAYIWLLRKVSVAAVSTYAYVNPVIALLLGASLGQETIGGSTLLGAVVILLGVGIVLRYSKR